MNTKTALIAFALVAMLASAHVATAEEEMPMNTIDDVKTFLTKLGNKVDLLEKEFWAEKFNKTKNLTSLLYKGKRRSRSAF